jgi:DNA polymerase-3 subunit epsilon
MTVAVAWHDAEILGFDFETTGVDRFSDVPVSFALVTIEEGAVVRSMSHLVDPGREIPPGATAVHGISTERARQEGIPLGEAIGAVRDALVEASGRGVPVAGMKLDYDLTILDAQSRKHHGQGLRDLGWTGPVLDAAVIDRKFDRYRKGSRKLVDLCNHYGVDLGNAHDAVADSAAAVAVLRSMYTAYPELAAADLSELSRKQELWHREWATSYSEWRERQGKSPLTPSEFEWPIASSA